MGLHSTLQSPAVSAIQDLPVDCEAVQRVGRTAVDHEQWRPQAQVVSRKQRNRVRRGSYSGEQQILHYESLPSVEGPPVSAVASSLHLALPSCFCVS